MRFSEETREPLKTPSFRQALIRILHPPAVTLPIWIGSNSPPECRRAAKRLSELEHCAEYLHGFEPERQKERSSKATDRVRSSATLHLGRHDLPGQVRTTHHPRPLRRRAVRPRLSQQAQNPHPHLHLRRTPPLRKVQRPPQRGPQNCAACKHKPTRTDSLATSPKTSGANAPTPGAQKSAS